LLRTLSDFVESREGLAEFGFRKDADTLETFGPSTVYGDFVGQQAAIERKGVLEGVEKGIGRFVEASTLEPVIFAFGHKVLSLQLSVLRQKTDRATSLETGYGSVEILRR